VSSPPCDEVAGRMELQGSMGFSGGKAAWERGGCEFGTHSHSPLAVPMWPAIMTSRTELEVLLQQWPPDACGLWSEAHMGLVLASPRLDTMALEFILFPFGRADDKHLL
jgi:hypothetical protein